MKRIALIGLVSLALFGCGEEKVTEEMLIGDWRCDATKQHEKWENGVLQDNPIIGHGETLVTYLKEDNKLFVKFPNFSDEKIKHDFKKYNKSYEEEPMGDKETAGFSKFEYISNNEFKWSYGYSMSQDEPDSNVKTKVKVLIHCTRIE